MSRQGEAAHAAFEGLLDQTTEIGAPRFEEPWHAQAFALTVELHRQGLFTWPEWAEGFSREIAQYETSGRADYFTCWLQALEALLIGKGLAEFSEMAALAREWRTAYATTPHGSPVMLAASDPKPDP